MKRPAIAPLLAAFLLTILAASAQTSVYKFTPDKPVAYLLELKQETAQEMNGETHNVSVDGTARVRLVVDKVLEGGKVHMAGIIENVLILQESAEGSQTTGSELKGKPFGFTLEPTGIFAGIDSIPDMGERMGEMIIVVSHVAGMFPKLDAEKMKVGSTWEKERVDTSGEEEYRTFNNVKSKFNVKGTVQSKKHECLELAVSSTEEASGKLSRGGAEYRLSGEGTRETTILMDMKEGMLVSFSTNHKTNRIIKDPNNSSFKVTVDSTEDTKIEIAAE